MSAAGFTPYYSDDFVTIYNEDCREVLPRVHADLVLTDPPYGIAHVWTKGSPRHGWGKANAEAELRNEWDQSAPDAALMELVLSAGDSAVIWGGNYFDLPPPDAGWFGINPNAAFLWLRLNLRGLIGTPW